MKIYICERVFENFDLKDAQDMEFLSKSEDVEKFLNDDKFENNDKERIKMKLFDFCQMFTKQLRNSLMNDLLDEINKLKSKNDPKVQCSIPICQEIQIQQEFAQTLSEIPQNDQQDTNISLQENPGVNNSSCIISKLQTNLVSAINSSRRSPQRGNFQKSNQTLMDLKQLQKKCNPKGLMRSTSKGNLQQRNEQQPKQNVNQLNQFIQSEYNLDPKITPQKQKQNSQSFVYKTPSSIKESNQKPFEQIQNKSRNENSMSTNNFNSKIYETKESESQVTTHTSNQSGSKNNYLNGLQTKYRQNRKQSQVRDSNKGLLRKFLTNQGSQQQQQQQQRLVKDSTQITTESSSLNQTSYQFRSKERDSASINGSKTHSRNLSKSNIHFRQPSRDLNTSVTVTSRHVDSSKQSIILNKNSQSGCKKPDWNKYSINSSQKNNRSGSNTQKSPIYKIGSKIHNLGTAEKIKQQPYIKINQSFHNKSPISVYQKQNKKEASPQKQENCENTEYIQEGVKIKDVYTRLYQDKKLHLINSSYHSPGRRKSIGDVTKSESKIQPNKDSLQQKKQTVLAEKNDFNNCQQLKLNFKSNKQEENNSQKIASFGRSPRSPTQVSKVEQSKNIKDKLRIDNIILEAKKRIDEKLNKAQINNQNYNTSSTQMSLQDGQKAQSQMKVSEFIISNNEYGQDQLKVTLTQNMQQDPKLKYLNCTSALSKISEIESCLQLQDSSKKTNCDEKNDDERIYLLEDTLLTFVKFSEQNDNELIHETERTMSEAYLEINYHDKKKLNESSVNIELKGGVIGRNSLSSLYFSEKYQPQNQDKSSSQNMIAPRELSAKKPITVHSRNQSSQFSAISMINPQQIYNDKQQSKSHERMSRLVQSKTSSSLLIEDYDKSCEQRKLDDSLLLVFNSQDLRQQYIQNASQQTNNQSYSALKILEDLIEERYKSDLKNQ